MMVTDNRNRVVDQQQRLRALDPATSFITQAPAGSGKTGLITQRYLVLLATVDAPEEIVAITFTRKAAGEMRQRILESLAMAGDTEAPQGEHERHTWELARRALQRDQQQGWNLLQNPGRMHIQTIDSLAASLARQMPLLSRFGSAPAIVEDARPLYLEAARNTIAELESSSGWSDAVAHLLRHLDNRLDLLANMLATMLGRRDQWLRHVADPQHASLNRDILEQVMQGMVEEYLQRLVASFSRTYEAELLELARFAASNLAHSDSSITACADMQSLPGGQVGTRYVWEGIAELLLTNDGGWRKAITISQGFPPPSSSKDKAEKTHLEQMKKGMRELLSSLAEDEGSESFRNQLHGLRSLLPSSYTDEEWETLQALCELLRLAAAQLELVFRSQGSVDFPAMAQAAITALGEPELPTDLALALDYRIRHLLVDEFQDTSYTQYTLIERLTAGWQPGDGHTLFVVGDPMQSIYRFREAEVGLFLEARRRGIGEISLEPLQLSVNFRSQQGIVEWVNREFSRILPLHENAVSGAVSYASSHAFHDALPEDAVSIHPFIGRDDEAEASRVVDLIRVSRRLHPAGTTTVLVRNRTHLAEIARQLRMHDMRFRAVEIESLEHRPVVQDLLSLTRALLHLDDRIAWLALLRSHLCAFSLKDLHALTQDAPDATILDLLHQSARVARLSAEAQAWVAGNLVVLSGAIEQRARCSLRTHVEGVWLMLGGPALVPTETDLEDAEVYLQLLEQLDVGGDIAELHELHDQVSRLFALPDVHADESLQLMTIHKSKGLEFDTVIIPGLGRIPRRDETKLLRWLELPARKDGSDLLLAPIHARGEDKNPISAYMQGIEQEKARYEDGRLLYVAATRARKYLHLLGHVEQGKEGEGIKPPASASLLASLWPVVAGEYQEAFERFGYKAGQADTEECQSRQEGHEEKRPLATIVRHCLPATWSLPHVPEAVRGVPDSSITPAEEVLEFSWAGEVARHVGTVTHRMLQQMGQVGVENLSSAILEKSGNVVRNLLLQTGVPVEHLDEAAGRVIAALQATLHDTRGKWILSSLHQDAHCEQPLSASFDGEVKRLVVDRTFVADGVRWIIDYKTGTHAGADVEQFLDREQERYYAQLEWYAKVYARIEQRPIRKGLYFPLLQGWREW